jgi:flagellar M-ring protein FliF
MSRFMEQVRGFLKELSVAKKVSFILAILMVTAGLAWMISWVNHADYRILYSDLSESDAGNIVQKLKEQKVPFQLVQNNTIMVPSDKLYEVRLDLANQGLPHGGSMGFELFDQNKLGMSEYVQKLNYQRALQGELARTISQFEEVKFARVHIVVPEKTLFAEQQTPPSASVVLQLRDGAHLNAAKVKSIVNLVSRSVEGLDTQRITVVDTKGEMLYAGETGSASELASSTHEELRSSLEQSLQRNIVSMLEEVVGRGKVIARVSADIEMKDFKQTRESYDPNTAVPRSEQRSTEESMNSEPGPSGAPGVQSNVMGETTPKPAASGSSNRFKKSAETINYEISKVIEDTVEPVRQIQRLSVAVLIDGMYEAVQGGDGKETQKYVPRTEEEMSKFKAIVEKAMGFSKIRGDQVEVVNLPFDQMKITKADQDWIQAGENRKFWAPYIKYGVMAVLVLAVFLFVVRPILRQITTPGMEVSRVSVLNQEMAQIESKPEVARIEEPQPTENDRILQLAQSNPEQFAQHLRVWIGEEHGR